MIPLYKVRFHEPDQPIGVGDEREFGFFVDPRFSATPESPLCDGMIRQTANVRAVNDTEAEESEVFPAVRRNLAVQPDGKILVGICSASGGTLLRLGRNGATDPLFEVARIADAVERIVVDHAGRVLIGGRLVWSGPNNQPRPGLARLHSNGALDAAYLANWPFGNPIRRFAREADDSVLVSLDERQWLDTEAPPAGQARRFYRLREQDVP